MCQSTLLEVEDKLSRSRLLLSFLSMVFIAAAEIAAAQNPAAVRKPATKVPAAVYVETQITSWTSGFGKWVAARPAVVQAHEASGSGPYMLRTPFLDYFAANGDSLYSGSTLSTNVDFVRDLPKSAEAKPGNSNKAPEPTLADYLDMLPELQPYKAAILARKRPVALAICSYQKPECVQQNQALQEFKRRAPSLKIQVIEVKLLNTSSQ